MRLPGVLLNLIIKLKVKIFYRSFKSIWFFIIGLLLFTGTIYYQTFSNSIFFDKVLFHSIIPFAFFLMIFGLYNVNFSRLKPLRFIAYYSYNWYLWHPIFVIVITNYLGNNITGFCAYILISFSTAVLFTILIEEPILNRRKHILNILFRNNELKASSIKYN